jgi:RNA recognition motif-containing protein
MPTDQPIETFFVSNVAFHLTEEDIHAFFSQHLNVISVTRPRDRETGTVRGFCFITVPQDDEEPILKLDGMEVGGRKIHVEKAVGRKP